MLLEIFTIITSVFGVLMSCSYFLQVKKLLKNKSGRNISIPMFVILGLGTILYFIYGLLIKDIVIMLGFGLGVIGTWMVVILGNYYRHRK